MFFSPTFELKSNVRHRARYLALALSLCPIGIADFKSATASTQLSNSAKLLIDSQTVLIDTQSPALDTQTQGTATRPCNRCAIRQQRH